MESLSLRFLYRTLPGRCVLKLLIRPGLSRLAGKYLDSRWSRWLIAPFIRKNGLDMAEYEPEKYASFNAFFARHKRAEFLRFDGESQHLPSPCDAFLSAYKIEENSTFHIKGSIYSLADLLGDAALSAQFRNGSCLIFRLTPRHYHRYHHIDGGLMGGEVKLPGVLHCVRPIACERYPVYVRNSREYAVIDTDHFGRIVQMEIGALLVGRIRNHPGGKRVERGEEKGMFEFGGSTIVLLFEEGRIALSPEITADAETPVRAGECIGAAK